MFGFYKSHASAAAAISVGFFLGWNEMRWLASWAAVESDVV
jgi:hypothetical protein